MRSKIEMQQVLINFDKQITDMVGAKLDLREWLLQRVEDKIQQKILQAFDGVFTGLSVRELEMAKELLKDKKAWTIAVKPEPAKKKTKSNKRPVQSKRKSNKTTKPTKGNLTGGKEADA